MSFLSTRISVVMNPVFCIKSLYIQPVAKTAVRYYAARKGTRARKEKKKVKVEEKKVGFIPHNQRNLDLVKHERKKFDDSWKRVPTDDVYVQKYFRWPVYTFTEAVECHRQTHHPEMYNLPDEKLHVRIELQMEGEKKTKFVDNFRSIVPILHKYDHGEERSILAFTKIPELQEQARQAGAQLAGGAEIIKEIQNGSVSFKDFQYLIAHPNIMPELVALRGLMKKRFPSVKAGTLDEDIAGAVAKFMHGITYSAAKDEYEKDFGLIKTVIGTLNMDAKCLEDNFAALVRDVNKHRPKREGVFISRCLLMCPPSREKFKIDHTIYIEYETDEIEEEAEEEEAVSVKN